MTIPDGFHARYFLETGLLQLLSKECSITVLIPRHLLGATTGISWASYDIEVAQWDAVNLSWFDRIALRMLLLADHQARIQNKMRVIAGYPNSSAQRFQNLIGRVILFVLPSLFWRHAFLISQKEKQKKLDRILLSQDVIWLATPSQKIYDILVGAACQRLRLSTISSVYSWDNLASKSIPYFKPARLLVWNDIMRSQAIDIYNYSANNVYAVGNPVFDTLCREYMACNPNHYRDQMMLGADTKILTIYTIPRAHYGDGFLELAKLLLAGIEKHGLSIHVVIRPHPLDSTDYSIINNKDNFTVAMASHENIGSLCTWSPSSDHIKQLAQSISGSDYILTVASTIILDSAVCGKKAFCLGFNLDIDHPVQCKSLYALPHMKQLVEIGNIDLFCDFERLFDFIINNRQPAYDLHKVRESYSMLNSRPANSAILSALSSISCL